MITLNVEDADVHTRMTAAAPSIVLGPAKWRVGDTVPNGDIVASTEVVGQIGGTLTMSLKGNGSAQLFYRHKDRNGATLSSGNSATITLGAGAEYNLAIGAAPATANSCELGVLTKSNPPGAPTRINRWLDPRCTTTSDFGQRYSWQHTTVTVTGAVTGLDTALKTTCPATQSASASRGMDLYQSPTDGVPDAYDGGNGVAVTPGEQITISGYMRSNKAIGARVQARCWSGTTWSAAAVYGTQVASAAGAWTRVSVTLTVPAGAEYLCAAFQDGNSTNWVANDYIYLTGVLFENSGSVATYFDGTTKNGLSGEVYWEDAPNESRSLLYSSALQTIEATDSSLNRAVFAEELVGAALERDFRRSVADIFNSAEPLITAGTPGLRKGTVTFLCSNLAQTDSLDYTYSNDSLVTLKDETDVAVNLVENPTYPTNDLTNGFHLRAQWGGSGGVAATSMQYDDGTYWRKTWTTASTTSAGIGWQLYRDTGNYQVAVNPGEVYTFGCKVRGTHGTVMRRWQCQFMQADKTTSVTTIYGPNEGQLTTDWQTTVWTVTVPAGAKYARPVLLYDNGATPTPVGATSDIKEVVVVKGSELPPGYFDGDTRPAGYNSRWNGTPNSSTSTLYKEGDLNGLKHRALNTRLSPETLPGKSAKWLYEVEFREQTR